MSAWDLDCVYITDGVCKGSYDAQDNNDVLNFGSYFGDCDTIGFYYQNPVINSPPQGALYESQVQYNCEFADPDWSYYEPILPNKPTPKFTKREHISIVDMILILSVLERQT